MKRGISIHLQEQTSKQTFLVLSPLCLCTEPQHRLCRRHPSPYPSAFYVPPPLRGFLLGLAAQIGGLVQLLPWPKDRLWSPSSDRFSHCCPSISRADKTHSSQEISVVLFQLPPPAGASRGSDPNCSSLAVAGLLPAVFSSD